MGFLDGIIGGVVESAGGLLGGAVSGIGGAIGGSVGSGLESAGSFLSGPSDSLGLTGGIPGLQGGAPLVGGQISGGGGGSQSILGNIFSAQNLSSALPGILGAVGGALGGDANLEITKLNQEQRQRELEALQQQREFENSLALLKNRQAIQLQALQAAAAARGEPELITRAFERAQQTQLAGAAQAGGALGRTGSNVIGALK